MKVLKKNPVYCIKCGEEVKERSDLVVANIKLRLKPFHKKCFNEHINEKKQEARMFFDAMPVNGLYGNIMTLIFIAFIIFLALFREVYIYIYVLCLFFPLFRLSSWLFFESRVPRK